MSVWGVSWLGSWGQSWGPLHEVDETWDTSQGVARNLANNLKYQRISDVEQEFYPVSCRTEIKSLEVSAEARAVRLPMCIATTSVGVLFHDVSANGYIVLPVVRAFSAIPRCDTAADSCASIGPVGGVCEVGRLDVAGCGEASGWSVAESTTHLCDVTALGILNPSDEEMTILITQLLTNKLRSSRLRA